jgi:hypothetical protein
MIKPWIQRSVEEANLLNPAFCCTILTSGRELLIGFNFDIGEGQ